jgi:two-component system CheB/CheR fusion protein
MKATERLRQELACEHGHLVSNLESKDGHGSGTDKTAESPGGLRFLIVEDHDDTRLTLSAFLTALGHDVTCARSMTEACGRWSDSAYDVLLSDIGLPDGDGWDLLCRLNPPGSVFAVAMSGYGREDDKEKSLAVGYKMHVVKPFLPDQLDEIIETARRHRQMTKSCRPY